MSLWESMRRRLPAPHSRASLASAAFLILGIASTLAQTNIAIWPGRAEVVAGNLANFLHQAPADSANVILASYSIHHFSTEAKVELINECRRVLTPGGTFIWIDAVRRNDESRDAYIARLTHEMANDWTALTPDQREKACTHVRESDFPETAHWMLSQVATAGFAPPAPILHQNFFDGWAFQKA